GFIGKVRTRPQGASCTAHDGLSLDNLGWISQTARKAAHRLGFPNWDGERYDGRRGALRR
ncbi:hypothetical protein ACUOJY_30105, partial [Escherichia coli]